MTLGKGVNVLVLGQVENLDVIVLGHVLTPVSDLGELAHNQIALGVEAHELFGAGKSFT